MKSITKPLVLAACLFVIVACSAEPVVETETAVEQPIKYYVVTTATNEVPVSYPGAIEAAQKSELTFQVSGLLQELPVIEGQDVRKGDLLAKLDQRDFRNSLAAAQAQFDNAEAAFKRAETLAAENAVSRAVFDQRKSSRDIARAELRMARKALEDTELRAPFDGYVAQVNVESFQNIAAQQDVMTLKNDGELDAVVDIPAQIVAQQPNFEPKDIVVTLDADPSRSIPAVFKEARVVADPSTQTYPVRFSFNPPPDLQILPGMSARIEATFVYKGEPSELGYSVPAGSISTNENGTFVWIIDEDTQTVSRRSVTVSEDRVGSYVTIISGLESGDVIAGAGAAYLYEGMQVRPWSKNNQ
ncbi:MAG: efflux RND transporter periplasmic adaptor subunit [Pseudomonadota bacterium]